MGITRQDISLGVLITTLHDINIFKAFEIVDTRSNMQLTVLNSKPNGGKGLRCIIGCAIGVHFILHRGQNITNSFSLTGSMDPLTYMIHTANI